MKLLNQCIGSGKQHRTELHSFDMVTLPFFFFPFNTGVRKIAVELIHFNIFTTVLNAVFLNCQLLFIIAGQQKCTDHKQPYQHSKYDTEKCLFLNMLIYIHTDLLY